VSAYELHPAHGWRKYLAARDRVLGRPALDTSPLSELERELRDEDLDRMGMEECDAEAFARGEERWA
jgi:hypothetical protein